MEEYYIFGDSHSHCFRTKFKNVLTFRASSARGLVNKKSTTGTNKLIINKIKTIDAQSKLVFLFGKVDMDFILNYKYNHDDKYKSGDFNKYIIDTVQSYIQFIADNVVNMHIYVCELSMPHLDDNDMLKIINIDGHRKNINSHLCEKDVVCVSQKFSKIIPYAKRCTHYQIFNAELQKQCTMRGFKVLEINKFFKNKNNIFKIPEKYINPVLDHHLKRNIGELYYESLMSHITL